MTDTNNTYGAALLPVTLKACPFCGFDSQCLTKVTAGAGMFDALQCQRCGATGPYNANYAVYGDGPTRWNTRAPLHATQEDAERSGVGVTVQMVSHDEMADHPASILARALSTPQRQEYDGEAG